MAEIQSSETVSAPINHGTAKVRESAVGTNDWLDEIIETLTSIANDYSAKFKERPELLSEFLPQQQRLVQTTFNLITLRGDIANNQPPTPPGGPVDKGTGSADDDMMEARIAKLETAVEFIQRDVKELKDDLRTVRSDITGIRTTDFRLTFGAIIAVALGLAGMMAKGFHWI